MLIARSEMLFPGRPTARIDPTENITVSAFLCSDLHTTAVAVMAVSFGLTDDLVAHAASLRDLNNAALASRYGSAPDPLPSDLPLRAARAWVAHHSPAAHMSVVTCLEYQCAEGDHEAHPAWHLLQSIKSRAGIASNDRRAADVWDI